jgi:hypothetical protein
MGSLHPTRPAVKNCVDAIDRAPLAGRERADFERRVYTKARGGRQAILRQILDHCGGAAECWVSNRRIADLVGYSPRYVREVLREFEAAEIVRCVVDRSVRTQRRIVILDHPNAVTVLRALGDCPWMDPGGNTPAAKPPANVHPGGNETVHPGGNEPVGAGGNSRPAESPNPPKSNPQIPVFDSPFKPRHPGRRRLTQAELLAQIEAMRAARPG